MPMADSQDTTLVQGFLQALHWKSDGSCLLYVPTICFLPAGAAASFGVESERTVAVTPGSCPEGAVQLPAARAAHSGQQRASS